MKKFYNFLNEEIKGFNIKDLVIVLIILLIYGFISFYKIGDFNSPQTFFTGEKDSDLIIELLNDDDVIKMKYYVGVEPVNMKVYVSSDNINYKKVNKKKTNTNVFIWEDLYIGEKCKYIKIHFTETTSLGELAFYNNSKEYIDYSSTNAFLNDEQDLIPDHKSYMNSTYFDEIYFARTAYQYVHGMQTYEWTHPPLGKLIQAIPIYLTGIFSPFTYRLMGNIAGILMLLVMYILGAIFFKKRGYAILSALIMGLDTFHFAHTRMGTVDSHLVLFIMISFLFMILFCKKKKNLYLLLSGIFFGLSVCVKWTGFYAGLGLAIIYFIHFIKNKHDLLESIVKGSVFFVVIPIILYLSCFYLFPNNFYYTNSFNTIIAEQKQMYMYHSGLKDDHPFSSPWYSWPISYKPVWYHQQDLLNNSEESISGVGNIVIWYSGIIGFGYLLYLLFKRKDKDSFYLIVIMLSLWLPYVFIGRVMFLYHYFPVLPFLFLGIVYLCKDLVEKYNRKMVIPIFLIFSLIFFILYYPVVSGRGASLNYTDWLEIFDSWYF